MKYFPDINRLPDKISVNINDKTINFDGAEKIIYDDVQMCIDGGKVTLTADKSEVKWASLHWKVRMPLGCRIYADAWERGYCEFEWRGISGNRPLPWYFVASKDDKTACYGVKTLPDSFCGFQCFRGEIILKCQTYNGKRGVILGGKTITCAEIVTKEYEGISAHKAMCDFAGVMAVNPVFPEKPVYGYNNWYYAYGRSSDEEIMENTKQLARLTKGLENRPYMVIDDCWQIKHWFRGGYNGGPWRESNSDFPDMKKLAEKISAMDILPGIWFRPLQNADERLRPYYTNAEEFILDPTYPEVLDYVAEDVKNIVGWGYKLIKHDFSTNDIFDIWGMDMRDFPSKRAYDLHDRSLTNAEIIKKVYKTIYDAADGKAIIIGCNCVGHLGTGYFHIHRSGDDTSGRQWKQTLRLGVNTLAFRAHQQGKFFFVDGDCAGLTEKIDFEQNKEWLRLLAYSGTPLFVSVGPETLNAEQEKYLAEMLAVASKERNVVEPLDWFDDSLPSEYLIDGQKTEFDWYK